MERHPPTRLALETQAYQVMLEGHRLDPDNDELYRDMLRARAAMEVAWLENQSTAMPGGD